MRRRRKRWLILYGLVAATIGVAYVGMREPLALQRAKNIRLGHTKAEVFQIMGVIQPRHVPNQIVWESPLDQRWIPLKKWLAKQFGTHVRSRTGDDYLVYVHFDASDRVDRIKRGDEVVDRRGTRTMSSSSNRH